jgi:class 3 adenylate cyclase
MGDPGETRIGDAERQQVIDALRQATGDGRLTLDEFTERAGEVFAARTRLELDTVVADLPPGVVASGPAGGAAAPAAAQPPPQPPQHRATPVAQPAVAAGGSGGRRRFVAIMGGSSPKGRWRAAEQITAFAFWGGVKVDLRQALIESPVLEITAWAIMGSVEVVVPDGIPVELDGFVLMGGADDHTRPGQLIEGAPVVRVKARGMWGGVVARNSRRRGRDRSRDRHGRHGHGPVVHAPPPLPIEPVKAMDVPPVMPGMRGEPAPVPRAPGTNPRSAGAAGMGAPGTAASSGSADREGARAEGPPRPRAAGGTVTVVVTDICGSTGLATKLGDQRWLGVLQTHNALVREQIHRHHGTEVKAQGDGFLITFTSARQAVLSAIGIQRALAEYRRAHPDHQLELRVGVHTGEVVEDHGDVIGQNVIVAVRIADAAEPGEVLVSSLTKDLTDSGGDLDYDAGREAVLKGVSRAWRVHAVAWD